MKSAGSRDLQNREYDGIRLGLTRLEVEAVAGSAVGPSFKRGGPTPNITVEYAGCFFVVYDPSERAIAIEFFAGSEPEFKGIMLLGRRLTEVLEDLHRVGVVPTTVDADGCDFLKDGFGLFTIDDRVDGVTLST